MYFIINTAVGDHFCALFDGAKNLVAEHTWEISRRDGAEVFWFLEEQKIYDQKISFIGGVTGPGGFTSLRVSSSILNALSFKFNLSIHQISAQKWIQNFIKSNYFVLNSFGDTVWIQDKSETSGLKKISTDEAVSIFAEQDAFVHFLPEAKQVKFTNQIATNNNDLQKNLLEALINTEAKNYFKAFYNVSPVS